MHQYKICFIKPLFIKIYDIEIYQSLVHDILKLFTKILKIKLSTKFKHLKKVFMLFFDIFKNS